MTRSLLVASYLVIFLLALLPRQFEAPVPMTGDEPLWMGRSIRFAKALASGSASGTYQSGHPGVTTMWIATLGAGLSQMTRLKSDQFSLLDPAGARAWAGARRAMILASSILVTLIAALSGRLLGHDVDLVAGVLLAGEPWLVGHGRILHLDGLSAGLISTSLLAALVFWERRGGLPFLVLASLAAGLAPLTRSGGLVVLPLLGLLALRAALCLPWRRRWEPLLGLALIVGCCMALPLLLWPAFRADPVGTSLRVWRFARSQAGEPHALGNFFLGQPVAVPGLSFYPLVLALRLSPLVPLGLLAWPIAWAVPGPRSRLRRLGPVALLAGGALLLLLAITPAAKKLDRYALMVVPLLELCAAAGLVLLVRRLGSARGLAGLLGLVGLVQLALCASTAPEYFTFYDPLLGGLPTASRLVLIGWGEELGPIAQYINQHSASIRPNVAVPLSIIDALRPQVSARLVVVGHRGPPPIDYVVSYINAEQRGQPPPPLPARLVVAVRRDGVDLARLYQLQPPDAASAPAGGP